MNTTIMLFLVQDGITNGAIYALLGLALVLVFAVTRVILIPQGEFVTFGALTYASLSAGQMPGTARLAVAMGVVAFGLDIFAGRRSLHLRLVGRALAVNIVVPSESLEIYPAAGATREALAAEYHGNVLPGVMERADVVGHLVQMAITLAGGGTVVLEGHVDKYRRGDLVPSADVWIAWRPQNATIIAA